MALQAGGPAAELGNAAFEFVDDLDFVSAHDIVHIAPEQHLGMQRIGDRGEERGVIVEIGDAQGALDLLRAEVGEEHVAAVGIDLEIAVQVESAGDGG
ncbi:MAG: hypothetical protein JNJ72_20120, partial [Anaerolineales bacterium]|nr:hypothetical protein [Anaerolineales bacterium]